MNSPLRLLALGIISFLLFAVITIPARIPLQMASSNSLSFVGVRGTIWNGSVDSINLPLIELRSTEWDLSLADLLQGEIGGKLKTRWSGGFLNGLASIDWSGNLKIKNTEANIALSWLASVIGLPNIDGQISASIDTLVLKNNWPEELIASIRADSLSTSLIGVGKEGLLGNAVATFDSRLETSTDSITGVIRDQGGPLQLEGSLVLNRPNNYSLSLDVSETAETSVTLRQNLDFLGRQNANGTRNFELSGTF